MFGLFLDHPQANIYLYKIRTIHYGIPYYFKNVRKNIYKSF